MSIIHLAVGDLTAQPIIEAFSTEEYEKEEIIVLKDILHVGPLKTPELNFSDGRAQFWTEVTGQMSTVTDLERLMEVSSRLSNDPEWQVWFWMAPTPADLVAYFWLLHFLKKHQGRFYVVNVNGLPFLDNNGKLFYPESIGYIPVKEMKKARKLARPITRSEWESDADEWPRLVEENTGIRIFKGGKKIESQPIGYYDMLLLDLISDQNQKATKIVNTTLNKQKVPTGDIFLHWRLKKLAEQGLLNWNKGEVKKADDSMIVADKPTTAQDIEQ